jgi:two-component system chemotaxis response regulator CheV
MKIKANEGILLESGTNEVEFIEFFLGDESYGVNVSKVQRVLALANVKITHVAGNNPSVRGIIYVQNKPIVLIDLRKALNLPDLAVQSVSGNDIERKLVLVLEFNRKTTGYIIDGVNKIHRTSWTHFRPMSESINAGKGGYTTGTITIDNRVILILDVERILLDFDSHKANSSELEADVAQIEWHRKREEISIMYAEDSRAIRTITENTLKRAGYTKLVSFENGQEAWTYYQQIQQKAAEAGKQVTDFVDLVITDIEMPELDGLTLCKNIKTSGDLTYIPKVMMYSSLINDQMARKCQAVGADLQLTKPRSELIISAIDELFDVHQTLGA